MRRIWIGLLIALSLSGCYRFERTDAPWYNLPLYYEEPTQPYHVIGFANASASAHRSAQYMLRYYAYKAGGDAAIVTGYDNQPTGINGYGGINYTGVLHAKVIRFDVPPSASSDRGIH